MAEKTPKPISIKNFFRTTYTGEGLVVLLPLGDRELVLFEQARGAREGERRDRVEGGAAEFFFFFSVSMSLLQQSRLFDALSFSLFHNLSRAALWSSFDAKTWYSTVSSRPSQETWPRGGEGEVAMVIARLQYEVFNPEKCLLFDSPPPRCRRVQERPGHGAAKMLLRGRWLRLGGSCGRGELLLRGAPAAEERGHWKRERASERERGWGTRSEKRAFRREK